MGFLNENGLSRLLAKIKSYVWREVNTRAIHTTPVENVVIALSTGDSTVAVMSQKTVTDELSLKADAADVYDKEAVDVLIDTTDVYTDSDLTKQRCINLENIDVDDTLSSFDTAAGENWGCLLFRVKSGDRVLINTLGGNKNKPYAVLDNEMTVKAIDVGEVSTTLTISDNGYVCVNCYADGYDDFVVRHMSTMSKDEGYIHNDILMYESIGSSSLIGSSYYDLSGEVAVDTLDSSGNWSCIKTPVRKGQIVTLYTLGGDYGRAYALTDSNGVIYKVSGKYADYLTTPAVLSVEKDGWLYANCRIRKNLLFSITKQVSLGAGGSTSAGFVDTYNKADLITGKALIIGEDGETQDLTALYRTSQCRCMVLKVKAGDSVQISTQGSSNYKPYALLDAEFEILEAVDASSSVVNATLEIEADGYVCVNCYNTFYDEFCIRHKTDVPTKERFITEDILMCEDIRSNALVPDCFYNLFGAVVSDTTTASGSWACVKVPVKKGQSVTLYVNGGTTGKVYALTDSDGVIYNVSGVGEDYISEPAVLHVEKDGYVYANTRSEYILYFRLIKCVDFGSGGSEGGGIVAKNPRAKDILSNVSFTDQGSVDVFTIAHISDTHGNVTCMDRFNEFCNHYDNLIQARINTGDVVNSQFSDDFDSTRFTDALIAVGNHDTAGYDGAFDWTAHQGSDAYNRYIAPLYTGWGVTLAPEAATNGYCFYYKDFANEHVRLIVLDSMAYNTEQYSAQSSWLDARLGEAKSLGYAVLIAYHYIPRTSSAYLTFLDTPFSSYNQTKTGGANHTSLVDKIAEFIADGGKFIAWMAGHSHADYIAKIVTQVDSVPITQLVLCVASGKPSSFFNARNIGEKSQDLFNVYGIDTYNKIVKIYRVGADYDMWGRHIETTCIKYETGEIIG